MDYDARNFLISGDFPLDKIVYLGEYSVTLTSFQIDFKEIPHNLTFTPLMMAQWSTFSDFRVAYGINAGPSVGIGRDFDTTIEADGTNIIISTQNRTTSTATVYYRMFAFMPSNVNEVAPFTSVEGDDYIINSDRNYMKLMYSDTATLGTTQSIVIEHGLGYHPRVMVWHTAFSGAVRPHFVNYPDSNIELLVRVTTATVTITNKNQFGGSMDVHYRIYADEA